MGCFGVNWRRFCRAVPARHTCKFKWRCGHRLDQGGGGGGGGGYYLFVFHGFLRFRSTRASRKSSRHLRSPVRGGGFVVGWGRPDELRRVVYSVSCRNRVQISRLCSPGNDGCFRHAPGALRNLLNEPYNRTNCASEQIPTSEIYRLKKNYKSGVVLFLFIDHVD